MSRRKLKSAETVSGEGWCGTWYDGTIGWAIASYLQKGVRDMSSNPVLHDDDALYLCEITITPKLDKLGLKA